MAEPWDELDIFWLYLADTRDEARQLVHFGYHEDKGLDRHGYLWGSSPNHVYGLVTDWETALEDGLAGIHAHMIVRVQGEETEARRDLIARVASHKDDIVEWHHG